MFSYFVYVLRSAEDCHFYIGHTNNVEKRLTQHNRGKVKSTKSRRPFEVVHVESFQTRTEAVSREKVLKGKCGISFKDKLRRSLDSHGE